MWRFLASIAAGLAVLWLAMLGLLWYAQRDYPDKARLREALRLVPDVIRLLHRLAADPALPRSIRIRLFLLLGYLLLPIDLVPDFIPVLGYADDAIIIAIALRSIARRAGPATIDRHWPGTPDGLRLIKQLSGLPTAPPG